MQHPAVEVAVIGAGNIGLAAAYYLVRTHGVRRIALIDPRDPMSLTSAQSGENYRNWWPHPVMTAFTNDGIRLLEDIARETDNRIHMTRRGYALVTRDADPAALMQDLYRGYGDDAQRLIRVHEAGRVGSAASRTYQAPASAAWEDAPDGVDVLRDVALIRQTFPAYAHDVATVLHVRRAGSISGQQLGQFQLETIRAHGGRLLRGEVVGIQHDARFTLTLKTADGLSTLTAERIVNAAGPFINDIAAMVGESLPVSNIYQQKIAFEDRAGIVPRTLPFTIDLDAQTLAWSEEDRELLAQDPDTAWLTQPMPGNIHCRPDGAETGKWIKLGWALNRTPSDPHAPDPVNPQFPDLVLRAASRLQAGLAGYVGRLPRGAHHYGGYYTSTKENWPLIGATATPGMFVAGALSGFGTMAACAAGALCADWVMEKVTAPYAPMLAPARYQNATLMTTLHAEHARGHL